MASVAGAASFVGALPSGSFNGPEGPFAPSHPTTHTLTRANEYADGSEVNIALIESAQLFSAMERWLKNSVNLARAATTSSAQRQHESQQLRGGKDKAE